VPAHVRDDDPVAFGKLTALFRERFPAEAPAMQKHDGRAAALVIEFERPPAVEL